MTNSVLNEAFDDHRSFYDITFYEFTVYFAKTYFLPFPPTIIEFIEALQSIPSRGTLLHVSATCGSGNTCDK